MEELRTHFEAQLKKIEDQWKKKFNIFEALHKIHDEERLHSRFIAYLLNPKEKHGKGDVFLRSFVEMLNKGVALEEKKIKLEENVRVETETENIDLLILDKSQAIIIENKIFAGDSNDQSKPKGYRGQLERYYNTILKGKEDDSPAKIQRDTIHVVYLTLDGRQAKEETRGETLAVEKVICICYTQKIKDWLGNCIKLCHEDQELIMALKQYQSLISKITSDVEIAKKNQEFIGKYINEGKANEVKTIVEKYPDLYKHIKWHTIADFYDELTTTMTPLKGFIINEKPSPEDITKVAHNENGKSTTKLVLTFSYKGQNLYLANDLTNGLTYGYRKPKIENGDWFSISKEIKFAHFDNNATFKLINKEERKKVIDKVIDRIIVKLLYIHGFGSSGNSGTAQTIQELLPSTKVIAPDLPLDPHAALNLLNQICQEEQPDVIIGTSMGGMFAQQMRGRTKILINPAFHVSESMQKRIGVHPFFNERKDGVLQFEVTQELCDAYREVESRQFEGIDEQEQRITFGFFGNQDTVVNCHEEYLKYYTQSQLFDGEHRLNRSIIEQTLIPFINKLTQQS